MPTFSNSLPRRRSTRGTARPIEQSPIVTTLEHGSYEALPQPRLIRKLWRQLDDLRPDVVVGCGYKDPPMVAAAGWAKRTGRPYVLMFETTAWDRPRPVWQELAKRWFLRTLVAAVFCGGTAHRQYLNTLGICNARIWEKYDVVDNDRFARGAAAARKEPDLRERLGLPASYFLYVGRLSPEKNLRLLLDAYQAYRRVAERPHSLVLVGDGPMRESLQALVRHLELPGVVWTGPQQSAALPAYYALSQALVLPSSAEPWGLVVNEAMACGLPVVVSSRAGSAVDLVQEGANGWTFDPRDPRALAERLGKVDRLDDAARRRMADVSRAIIANYTPLVWGRNLADCIRHVAQLG